ncbi:MAG: hypothetical protein A2845_04015 [Candidatus Lloydbacteria bacterium RIFCSPHIGHO2_01_FULL_49_22]|uniref:Uncharacterized protein n=1 Tax=Candidatus Lloydbacteria bacterium RIFCSPHIGHO2_01_FULL_49_22 TaxID=1798658 RepID=A0A1G2CX15_9BACT|nr:MAG: hypothetical protein A2845_04015 [Candidatus Lloydbacteria bacterium RIFCSPHIGHO2_01_FULL_49_22]OGZ09092.1 MAG: hypothetical protein A3C14_03850 [Candidatus Lloydbacteria bacterium RIFCSPHIGHO2_02_FULL_50_18]
MKSSTRNETKREEFDALLLLLTGMVPSDAEVSADGFLFIPPNAMKMDNASSRFLRVRITELAGPNGWRNHLVDDKYAGWWIRRPTC